MGGGFRGWQFPSGNWIPTIDERERERELVGWGLGGLLGSKFIFYISFFLLL